MAAELVMTGDVRPSVVTAVDEREFSIVRKGYDPGEVKVYLAEVEANLRLLEDWALRTNAKLSRAEEKIRAMDDVDDAVAAVFEERSRLLDSAQLQAERIRVEAEEQARAEAEVLAAQIVAEAKEDARRTAERILAATTPATDESIRAAARVEADRMLQRSRAEAELLIVDARLQAAKVREQAGKVAVDESGPEFDASIGSARMAGLIVDMTESDADRGDSASDAGVGYFAGGLDPDTAKRSRYQRTSADLPTLGREKNDAQGVVERMRERFRHD